MSVNLNDLFAGEYDIEEEPEETFSDFYEDDCTPPVRVYVGGDEIPVINKGVETQARTDGPMDINKVSDVYFPAEWQGENIVDKIEAFNPDEDAESVWEPVDIKFLDPKSDEDDPEYITYHRGFPIGYGAGSTGTIERRLRVGDAGMLLNNTPFTGSYKYDASINDILTDLFDEFESHQDVFEVAEIAHIDQVLNEDMTENLDGDIESNPGITDLLEPVSAPIAEGVGDLLGTTTSKSFKSNRDTLQDVIEYITKKVDGELYFAPSGDDPNKIALVYDQNRTNAWYPEHLTQMEGTGVPRVIQNNALYEIQPINSVKVKGKTDRNLLDTAADAIPAVFEGDQSYPTATARHNELHRLAGEEYQPPVLEIDATSVSEAEDEAREELMDRIQGGGMGEITLYLFPHIDPHDIIHSKPSCGHNVAHEIDEISYSVEEVTQKVGYDEDTGQMKMRTHLRVNTHTTSDDIEIVDSGTEKL